jgi:hypothetical protein
VTPLHMGSLHPYEQALTLLLAFGPFAVLGVVVWRRARHDAGQEATEDPAAAPDQSVAEAEPRR